MKEFFKGLSWVQLVAGAGAAVTSLLLSTRIGISGSLIGAAVASVVSAVSSQVYKNVLNTSTKKIKQGMGLAEEEEQAARPTDAASAPRVRSDERAGQHVGWWEREQGTAGHTQAAGATPADGTVAQWDAATVRMQAQAARGAHAEATATPLADVPAWGVPQATDEQDAAAALSSFDAPIDPTVAGMGAVGVAGSAQAGRTASAAAPSADRTMRMPSAGGRAAAQAGVGTDASAYGRSTYVARVRGGRAATGGRDTRGAYSAHGTAAAGEAWGSPTRPASLEAARGKRRGQVLGAAVAFLSALAAVIVCAVVISVATSGEGLGYKPASTWLPAPAEQASTDAGSATDAAKSAVADAVSSLVQGATQAAGTAASAVTDAVAGVTGTTTTGGSASSGATTPDAPATDSGAGTGEGAAGTGSGGETTATPDAGAGDEAGAGADAGADAGATDAAGDTATTAGTGADDGSADAAGAGEGSGEAAAA